MKIPLFSVANEAGEFTVENSTSGEAIFAVQQNGRLFVPYGNYAHAQGLQLFNKESATLMAGVFNSLGSKLGRLFSRPGVPVYRGHPDVPNRPDSNPSAPAIGWIEGITPENDGAYFEVKWNEDGQKAVSSAQFRFYSPHWGCRKVKGGIQPVQLLSVGLTNNPRIPVPAIANDESEVAGNSLARISIALGLAESAPLESVLASIATLRGTASRAVQAENDLAGSTANLREQSETVASLRRDLAAANDAAAIQEKTRFAKIHVEALVRTGRVTGHQSPILTKEFVSAANEEVVSRLVGLYGGKPLFKTYSVVGNLGGAASKIKAAVANDLERKAQRAELIEEQKTRIGKEFPNLSASEIYTRAFNFAQTLRPELFQPSAS